MNEWLEQMIEMQREQEDGYQRDAANARGVRVGLQWALDELKRREHRERVAGAPSSPEQAEALRGYAPGERGR